VNFIKSIRLAATFANNPTGQNPFCVIGRRLGSLIWLILALLVPSASFSASLYTEIFSDSTGGWQDRSSFGLTVTNSLGGNPDGCLRGFFDAQFGPPTPPFEDAFIATGNLASASFIGDYDDVDAWLLGFDIMASNIVPVGFEVFIHSGSNFINRSMTNLLTVTNTWYSFKIPLLDASSGGWSGNTSQFGSILANVSRVEFRVTRNNTGAQSYYMDNIFLDRLPDAAEITSQDIIWLHLRNGSKYRHEAVTDLSQPVWNVLDSFIATNSVYQINISTTNDWRFFRMILE